MFLHTPFFVMKRSQELRLLVKVFLEVASRVHVAPTSFHHEEVFRFVVASEGLLGVLSRIYVSPDSFYHEEVSRVEVASEGILGVVSRVYVSSGGLSRGGLKS